MKKSELSGQQMVPRRDFLKFGAVAGALGIVPLSPGLLRAVPVRIGNRVLSLRIAQVTAHTVRLTVIEPAPGAHPDQEFAIPSDGSLSRETWPNPATRVPDGSGLDMIAAGNLRIHVSPEPLTISIQTADGGPVQTLTIDRNTACLLYTSRCV